MSKSDINEQRTAAASYILNFYQQVALLTDTYSNYNNLLTELDHTYSNGLDDMGNMDEQHSQQAKETIQITRFHMQKTYILYSTITKSIKIDINKDMEKQYNKMKKDFVINRDELESFVISMNHFLLDNIIKELLENSAEIMENVYKDD